MKHLFLASPRRALTLVGVAVLALTSAADTYFIKDGAHGKWSSPDIWSTGVPPQGTSDDVYIEGKVGNTQPIEIEIDGDCAVGKLIFGQDAVSATQTRPPITFTGSGTLRLSGTGGSYIYVRDGHHVVFDGPQFDYKGSVTVKQDLSVFEVVGNSRMELFCEGESGTGAFSLDGKPTIRIGGSVVVSVRDLNLNDATLVIDGGSLKVCAREASVASGKVRFTKGTVSIVQQSSAVTAGLFKPEGPEAVLISRANSVHAYATRGGVQGESYFVPGKIFVTNGVNSTLSVASAATDATQADKVQNAGFWGRGDVYAQTLESNGQYLPNGTKFYSDFDVASLNLAYDCNGASTEANRIPIWRTATLGLFGDFDYTRGSARSMVFEAVGDLTIDTLDCFDRTTVRNMNAHAIYANAGSTLTVTGGGRVDVGVAAFDTHQRWNALTVGANTTLAFRPRTDGGVNGSTWPTVFVGDLTLGAGARLPVTAGLTMIDATGDLSFDPTSALDVTLPANPAAGAFYPVLSAQSGTDVSTVPVNFTPTGNWQVKRAEGLIYLHDGSADAAKTEDAEWTGATDNKWTTGSNWNGGAQPVFGDSTTVIFSGTKNVNIVYDDTTARGNGNKLKALKFLPGGPYHLTGNELHLIGRDAGYDGATINSRCALPVVIDNDIYHNVSATSGFGPTAMTNSYIQLNGKVTCTDNFSPAGDIRIGGTLTCVRFTPLQNRGTQASTSGNLYGPHGRQTRLSVLPGAKVTVTAQSQNLSGTGDGPAIDVFAGGLFEITGGTQYWITAKPFEHFVDGTFDCRIPIGGTQNIDFAGKGKVYLAGSFSASADCNIGLGSGITLYPDAWYTATADNPATRIRLVVHTYATLGATNDWTYGVADGVTATTTAEGHTVTFADPIVGYGRVEKTGKGTLCLAAACTPSNGVAVTGGTLAWTVPQTIAKLSAASGTELKFGLVDGAPAKLTVGSDLDLTGVTLTADGGASFDSWTTVIEASGDATLSGTPVAGSDSYKCRVVGNVVQCKDRKGMLLILR